MAAAFSSETFVMTSGIRMSENKGINPQAETVSEKANPAEATSNCKDCRSAWESWNALPILGKALLVGLAIVLVKRGRK